MSITQAERLYFDRRRQGETQKAAAEQYGISYRKYLRCERGLDALSRWGIQPPPLGRLRPHERCILARRRAGLTQEQIAKAIGRCRRLVIMMERGEIPCTKLEEYWSE